MNYKVIILKKTGEKRFEKIKEEKVKLEDGIISYEGKTAILPEISTYVHKKTTYLFFNYDDEKFIMLHEHDIGLNARFLDKFLSTSKMGIIGQLMSAIKAGIHQEKNYSMWIFPIMAGIIGFFIGYIM